MQLAAYLLDEGPKISLPRTEYLTFGYITNDSNSPHRNADYEISLRTLFHSSHIHCSHAILIICRKKFLFFLSHSFLIFINDAWNEIPEEATKKINPNKLHSKQKFLFTVAGGAIFNWTFAKITHYIFELIRLASSKDVWIGQKLS